MSSYISHQKKSNGLHNVWEETKEMRKTQGIFNNILYFAYESQLLVHNGLSLVRIIAL